MGRTVVINFFNFVSLSSGTAVSALIVKMNCSVTDSRPLPSELARQTLKRACPFIIIEQTQIGMRVAARQSIVDVYPKIVRQG